MKLIIGLGNPGKEYENTRHNVGFMALDRLAEFFGAKYLPNKKFNAAVAEAKSGRKKIILAKPLTFMNEAGRPVRALADFYKIKASDIAVVHDDKDISAGEFKFQSNRSSAGHKGVQSVIDRLKIQNFIRLRIGIKPARDIRNTADFVLGKITKTEKKILDDAIGRALQTLKNEL